jgi:hypothetical protein
MATRLYGANPGYNLEQVTEGVGSATSSHNVELTVDLATTVVNDNGTTRAIQKQEVLLILDLFAQYITRGNWLPA